MADAGGVAEVEATVPGRQDIDSVHVASSSHVGRYVSQWQNITSNN